MKLEIYKNVYKRMEIRRSLLGHKENTDFADFFPMRAFPGGISSIAK